MNEITLKECADLIERLLSYAKNQGGWHNIDETCEEAASEISRLTEEVERRKLEVHQLEEFIGRREDDVLAIARRAEAAEARVKELEAALAPFAKAGELFPARHPESFNESIYQPAAGREFAISGDDLRRAREALHPDAGRRALQEGE